MIKRIILSVLGGLILPTILMLDLQFNGDLRNDNFPGNLLTVLAFPGYFCASIVFPEEAQNESVGLVLFPSAMMFNFLIYTLAINTTTWLVGRMMKGEQLRAG